jgi:signal transduction histidine kinase
VSAQEFLSTISQVAYLALFAIAAVRLVRRPASATIDMFLFFGVIAVLLLAGDIVRWFGMAAQPQLNIVNWLGISALPLILLRLADDFRAQPTWLLIASLAVYGVVALVGIVATQPWEPAVSLVPVAYVVVLGIYASLSFLRAAFTTTGVTRRRMQAVALGSGLLAVILLLAGVSVVWPDARTSISILNQLVGLALVLSYFVGFAPPAILRRAWQEPALRGMLAEAAELVRLPDATSITARIEERAREVTGAEGAAVGLWDETTGMLRFQQHPVGWHEMRPGEAVSGRAFAQQAPFYTSRAERDAPENAQLYRQSGIRGVVAAPITSGEGRIGVLTVYAARPPAFTDDVVDLVTLLAEQAALVLRSHTLLAESAHVRALAEVTRLKDDFLSVVAHDVRTPLTTILLNAELLQQSVPAESTQGRRAERLRTEALRLKHLVEDYLDVVRAEHDREVRKEPGDLAVIVRETISGMTESQRISASGDTSVPGVFDTHRLQQMVQNLVSNALKYSDADRPVEVVVCSEGDDAVLEVRDRGIGIPVEDIPLLFERFHRGTNTDDRRYAGLGLGLYICRQIAREHGGDVTVTSRVDEGSTFTVRLFRGRQPTSQLRRADETATAPARRSEQVTGEAMS